MLRSANELKGYILQANDGEIGRCKDFLFDDEHWTIRYMVADTRKWLPGRKVLISPISFGAVDWENRRFPVQLSCQQIKEAPALEEDAPVSRQFELRYHRYYAWPVYWGGSAVWGSTADPAGLFAGPPLAPEDELEATDDPHLRSVAEISRYSLKATDGELGHVVDVIVHDKSWTIRFLVVDTGNWLPGRKVLIAPQWAKTISWLDSKVTVELSRDQVKDSPQYDPATPIGEEYESQLYDFYGRLRP
jgi:hypothetical protein